jgi:hypothetical protein
MRTPRPCKAAIVCRVLVKFTIGSRSVTSNTTWENLIGEFAKIVRTSFTIVGSLNSLPTKLNAIIRSNRRPMEGPALSRTFCNQVAGQGVDQAARFHQRNERTRQDQRPIGLRRPKARITWAHNGFSVPPARVGQLLNEHKDALWSELSYRGGVAGGDGKLTSDWRSLFESYSFDFLLGSDTRINERWFDYDKIFKEYRNWLAQISLEQARRIASGNALRLFGPQARN